MPLTTNLCKGLNFEQKKEAKIMPLSITSEIVKSLVEYTDFSIPKFYSRNLLLKM
jgi:hypothetical protein